MPPQEVGRARKQVRRPGGDGIQGSTVLDLRNLNLGAEGTRASHEEGPGAEAPSRSRARPASSVEGAPRSSRNSKAEVIAEMRCCVF